MDNLTTKETGIVKAIDVSWLLFTGMNILIMQSGFTALEAGGSRAKYVKSVLFKNFMDHSVGSLAWFTVGWGLFTGKDPFAAGPDATFFVHSINDYPRLFQQFAFAATSATIVSGAVSGRCKLVAYVIIAAFLSGITYPIIAHWAWDLSGWLAVSGFLDYAGSVVVHCFGGACALGCASVVGPRPGRFAHSFKLKKQDTTTTLQVAGDDAQTESEAGQDTAVPSTDTDSRQRRRSKSKYCIKLNPPRCRRPACPPSLYKPRMVPRGYNPPLMVVGSLLLYVAWFSFNAGSSGSIYLYPDGSARAAVNTMLAAGAGSVTCMLISLLTRSKYDIEFACNAMLSALVAVTAPCGFVEPWAACIAGVLAVPIYMSSNAFVLQVLGVDDTLGAISVHGACGAFGGIWLGFTHPTLGAFYGYGGSFLWVQTYGVLVIAAFGLITTFFLCWLIHFFNFLSYSQNEQLIGIDLIHFGGEFGKDIDLESDGNHKRRDSGNSLEFDMESADGIHSQNSAFVEEFPTTTVIGNRDNLAKNTSRGTLDHQGSMELNPLNTSVSNRDLQLRNDRAFSVATMEGRREAANELRRVLDEDPRIRRRFRAYLDVMYAGEGVEFWDEVSKWKQLSVKKHPQKKISEAKRIIKCYAVESARTQVNLESRTVLKLKKALDDPELLKSNTLFDQALEELFKDLKASFVQFVQQTPNYWL